MMIPDDGSRERIRQAWREIHESVYYAANAMGRLMGILLSGALYQIGGMPGCLMGSAAMLAACLAITFLLPAKVLESRASTQLR